VVNGDQARGVPNPALASKASKPLPVPVPPVDHQGDPDWMGIQMKFRNGRPDRPWRQINTFLIAWDEVAIDFSEVNKVL